jgi:hypothetical protein
MLYFEIGTKLMSYRGAEQRDMVEVVWNSQQCHEFSAMRACEVFLGDGLGRAFRERNESEG